MCQHWGDISLQRLGWAASCWQSDCKRHRHFLVSSISERYRIRKRTGKVSQVSWQDWGISQRCYQRIKTLYSFSRPWSLLLVVAGGTQTGTSLRQHFHLLQLEPPQAGHSHPNIHRDPTAAALLTLWQLIISVDLKQVSQPPLDLKPKAQVGLVVMSHENASPGQWITMSTDTHPIQRAAEEYNPNLPFKQHRLGWKTRQKLLHKMTYYSAFKQMPHSSSQKSSGNFSFSAVSVSSSHLALMKWN